MLTFEGFYGYQDANDGLHIRSGKVTSNSFLVRHEQHSREAKDGTKSLFYRQYPSTSCQSILQSCKGSFKNLWQLVYFSYNPRQEGLDEYLKEMFVLSPIVGEKIKTIRFNHPRNILSLENKKKAHVFLPGGACFRFGDLWGR